MCLHMREKCCPAGWQQAGKNQTHQRDWAATKKPEWRATVRQHETVEGRWVLGVPARSRGEEGSVAEFFWEAFSAAGGAVAVLREGPLDRVNGARDLQCQCCLCWRQRRRTHLLSEAEPVGSRRPQRATQTRGWAPISGAAHKSAGGGPAVDTARAAEPVGWGSTGGAPKMQQPCSWSFEG